MTIYDLALKKPWRAIFQYPLAAIFLVDFKLTWRMTENALRGDIATNISSGPAMILGKLGGLLRRWR